MADFSLMIETPKSSRNKYAYDFNLALLRLKKTFPFDFGAIPGTITDDGDPLEVLVMMQESVPGGCLVEASLVGVIEAEKTQRGKGQRNDRLVAVADEKSRPSELKSIRRFESEALDELKELFITL